MQTLVVDIFDDEGIKILENLELKKVLHIHKEDKPEKWSYEQTAKYMGKMTKQPIEEVDKQLKELRDSWE